MMDINIGSKVKTRLACVINLLGCGIYGERFLVTLRIISSQIKEIEIAQALSLTIKYTTSQPTSMPKLSAFPAPIGSEENDDTERKENRRNRSHSPKRNTARQEPTTRKVRSRSPKRTTRGDDVSKTNSIIKGVKRLTITPVKKIVGMVSPKRNTRTRRKDMENLTRSEVEVLDGFQVNSQTKEVTKKERKKMLKTLDQEFGNYKDGGWEGCEHDSSAFY